MIMLISMFVVPITVLIHISFSLQQTSFLFLHKVVDGEEREGENKRGFVCIMRYLDADMMRDVCVGGWITR